MSHLQSSGRGGAGNIVESAKSPKIKPQDLETPTLKGSMVTTGRGGSGNMAKNTDAAETRALQDVEPVTRRESHGATHVGRGGTGNVVVNPDEAEEGQQHPQQHQQKKDESAVVVDEESPKPEQPGWAEKGKQFLFGKR